MLKRNDRIFLILNRGAGCYEIAPALFGQLCRNPKYCDAVYRSPSNHIELFGSGRFAETFDDAKRVVVGLIEEYRAKVLRQTEIELERLQDASQPTVFPIRVWGDKTVTGVVEH